MKLPLIPILLFLMALLTSCQQEDSELSESFGHRAVTITLECAAIPQINCRGTADETIDNVLLLVFNDNGQTISTNYQAQIENNHQIALYLEKEAHTLYAICNVPEDKKGIWEKVRDLNALKNQVVQINRPDLAYTGKQIMVGATTTTTNTKSIVIPVSRITAELNFKIYFDPKDPKDQFNISAVYLHNIPNGTYLVGKPNAQSELDVCTDDYVYQSAAGDRKGRYFYEGDIPMKEKMQLSAIPNGQQASFYIYENRQGGIADSDPIWDPIKGLENQPDPDPEYGNLYNRYRQIYKRKIALEQKRTVNSQEEIGFPYATYLTIEGLYKSKGRTHKVKYYMYLGLDNYKDFNICRNTKYNYKIRIHNKDLSGMESRLETEAIGEMEIMGDFGEQPLDAHYNTQQGLLYANDEWTLRVKDPDQTPWLELSTSSMYQPHFAGEKYDTDMAAFRIDGKSGLHYFYVHTDEYVPEVADTNPDAPDNSVSGTETGIRTGTIVCESKGKIFKEIQVKQYAAQKVILVYTDYHPDETGAGKKEVRDTLYVERILENKHMSWGFEKYWCFILDDMIAAGRWDGLANTRRLYQAAVSGDKWDTPPAYGDVIPFDTALGYTLSKNRDRNGNGKIDYNEIVWYLPALEELKALSTAVTEHRVHLDETFGQYHSSTPSASDPYGVDYGRSYYVDMENGKTHIGLRNRKCNVICVRRAHTWQGPHNGDIAGEVGQDPQWNDEEETIIPKPATKG